MPKSLTNFRDELLSAVHDLLWQQWASLGAGVDDAASMPSTQVIDPEALLLATSHFGRREPRLFDESLEWLARYGGLINVQRLKNLQRDGLLGEKSILAAMATHVKREGGLSKWGTLASTPQATRKHEPEPFFITGSSKPAHWGEADADFLSRGWLKAPARQRDLCMPPSPAKSSNALLTLRALIGVSARCEVILYLLTHPFGKVADMVNLTGYSAQAVLNALDEMALSGTIYTDGGRTADSWGKKGRGRSLRYSLKPVDWQPLLPAAAEVRWQPWFALLALAQATETALASDSDTYSLLPAMQVRRVLDALTPQLAEAGIASRLGCSPNMTGSEMLSQLAETLPSVLRSA
jgi:hypothetical protein